MIAAPDQARSVMDARIQLALASITRASRARHDLHALASDIQLSVSRFYDLFRAETGTAPARYIRALRLQMARDFC